MSRLNIYVSYPMKYEDYMHKEILKIEKFLKGNDNIETNFFLPENFETKYDEYYFSDNLKLLKSDLLLIHLPEPSIGAVCELAIFKTYFPKKCAIGYKCVDHSWLKFLLDYQLDDLNAVQNIILNISKYSM